MFDDQDEEQVLSRMFAALFALALVMTPVAVFAEDDAKLSFAELDSNGDGQELIGQA